MAKGTIVIKIVLHGWKPGFNKVGLNRLLRTSAGFSLGEAKNAVDAILNNDTVVISVRAEDRVSTLAALECIGVSFSSRFADAQN